MPRQVTFEGQTYTFPDDATDDEIAEALASSPAPRQSQAPAQRNRGYNDAAGGAAAYIHGATIGTGDEIAGLAGGAAEAVQSFIDPGRADRPRGGELTPIPREEVSRFEPVQRSAALRLVESMAPGETLDEPIAPPARQPRLGERFSAAAEGAVRGFDETQDRFLEDYQQFRDERPIASTVTEIGGGLLSPANALPVGRLGQNAPIIGGTGVREAARTGAIYGTGYAVATGDEWGFDEGDRLNPRRLGEGAAWGAGGGAAAQQIVRTAGGIGSRFGRTPEQRAVRLIDRSLRDANVTPQELRRRAAALRRQGGQTMETVAEVGGQPLQRAARAVANVRGPGQQIATDALEARTNTITPRVLSEATRATGQNGRAPRNYFTAREQLRSARSGQARQAYRAAYANGLDQNLARQELIPLMTDGSPEALASGARLLESETLRLRNLIAEARMANAPANEVAALTDDLADTQRAIEQLRTLSGVQEARATLGPIRQRLASLTPHPRNEAERLALRRQADSLDARARVPNELSPRAVDFYQRGLRQMAENAGVYTQEGSALAGVRDTFNRVSDRIAPTLGDARNAYAGSRRVEDLMADGRRIFEMPDGEIDILLQGQGNRGLSAEEFDGFMLGALDAIERKVRAGDTAFVARFMRNENWQRQLERALGRQGARRLRNRIGREASMRGFDNAVRRPSQTTPMREDIQALTEGEAELNFLAEVIQSGGTVRGPLLRRLAGVFDRLYKPGIYNEQVNRALAERLYGRATPGNIARLEAELAALPGYNQAVAGEDFAGRIGARIGAIAPNRPEEPRRVGGTSFVE